MGLFGNKRGGHAAESEVTVSPPDAPAPATVNTVDTSHLTPEARRIAELLSISPDMVNVTVNVGFNTKLAVEEILE